MNILEKYRHMQGYDPENQNLYMELLLSDFKKRKSSSGNNGIQLKISGVSSPNVKLYTDLDAFVSFTEFILDNFKASEKFGNHVDYIYDFFCKSMVDPGGGILTKVEVESLLTLVQDKFGLISAVTYTKDLDIYLINRSHICYDSFLLTHKKYKEGSWQNRLMLFSMSPCIDILECNRFFIFLHEIGHALYNCSLEKGANAPDFFKEVTVIIGLPGATERERQDELFADIFAAATLHDSAFSDFNPYKQVLSEDTFDFLELYIRMLACMVERENYRFPNDFSIIN